MLLDNLENVQALQKQWQSVYDKLTSVVQRAGAQLALVKACDVNFDTLLLNLRYQLDFVRVLRKLFTTQASIDKVQRVLAIPDAPDLKPLDKLLRQRLVLMKLRVLGEGIALHRAKASITDAPDLKEMQEASALVSSVSGLQGRLKELQRQQRTYQGELKRLADEELRAVTELANLKLELRVCPVCQRPFEEVPCV